MVPGTVKTIIRFQGEAVKKNEPVLQIQYLNQLKVEGLIEAQDARDLDEKQKEIQVEVSQPRGPRQELSGEQGHQREVTCVAVTRGKDPLILSGSEDRTLRIWGKGTNNKYHLQFRLPHKVAVRSLAVTGKSAEANRAVVGLADGTAEVHDLDQVIKKAKEAKPTVLQEGKHEGAVNCVAFSAKGTWCATGGDDRAISVWDADSGKRLAHKAEAHRGPVTSLQITPEDELVSAGQDGQLIVWKRDGEKLVRARTIDRRGRSVAQLGLSTDGTKVLFDQGKELQVRALASRQIEGVLQNPEGMGNFTTLALFSPDGKTILTNTAADGRLQMWRAPTRDQHASELLQLIKPGATTTCGAFAPDGDFVVTGTQNREVLIWDMPKAEEMQALKATLKQVERTQEGGSRNMRITAELELEEKPDWLVPGATATMVLKRKGR
jgi:WD40 repeat protein